MKEEIQNILLEEAVKYHLSDYDQEELNAWMAGEMDNAEFFESENTIIWEPFQFEDADSMWGLIWNQQANLESLIKRVIEIRLENLVERIKEIQNENN
jgi:hypothetical protein